MVSYVIIPATIIIMQWIFEELFIGHTHEHFIVHNFRVGIAFSVCVMPILHVRIIWACKHAYVIWFSVYISFRMRRNTDEVNNMWRRAEYLWIYQLQIWEKRQHVIVRKTYTQKKKKNVKKSSYIKNKNGNRLQDCQSHLIATRFDRLTNLWQIGL